MDQNMIQAISLIKSSEYRFKILKAIGDDIIMPSEISKKIDIRLNHVSTFLQELKKKGLIECLNEDAKKGRLYQLTKLGKYAIAKVE
ncbi:MAG: MarR family transcriptional regulator [Candidatus Aenigmarchaeota archaeon]|nr:MarR family transcriptional regulator [Candidatus Aenigmarchaeota archaeon]